MKRFHFPFLISLYKTYTEKFSIMHNGDYSYLVVLGFECFEIALQLVNIDYLCRTKTWETLSGYNTIVGMNEVSLAFFLFLLPSLKAGTLLTVDIAFDLAIVYVNVQVGSHLDDSGREVWISTIATAVPLLRSLHSLEMSLYVNVHSNVGRKILAEQVRTRDKALAQRLTISRIFTS